MTWLQAEHHPLSLKKKRREKERLQWKMIPTPKIKGGCQSLAFAKENEGISNLYIFLESIKSFLAAASVPNVLQVRKRNSRIQIFEVKYFVDLQGSVHINAALFSLCPLYEYTPSLRKNTSP
jgi:hypothetical protein